MNFYLIGLMFQDGVYNKFYKESKTINDLQ